MNTTIKKTLMTVSAAAFIFTAAPALANPEVMCSIKANYQPGVSVNGKSVTPADLSAPALPPVRIPLTVDLAKRMNGVLPDGMKLDMETGIVDILSDGHVLFNGKDLTGPATALCSTLKKEAKTAKKTKDAPKKKRAADVPANVDEAVVEAQPVTPVAAEPMPAPAPTPEVVPEVAPEVVPQQLAPAQPAVLSAPQPEEVPQPAVMPEAQILQPAVPAPEIAPEMPPQPNEILSPTEGGMIPRPPEVDPFGTPPLPSATEGSATEPGPAPDEMLSGGGQ